jgi:hypothetical protein
MFSEIRLTLVVRTDPTGRFSIRFRVPDRFAVGDPGEVSKVQYATSDYDESNGTGEYALTEFIVR